MSGRQFHPSPRWNFSQSLGDLLHVSLLVCLTNSGNDPIWPNPGFPDFSPPSKGWRAQTVVDVAILELTYGVSTQAIILHALQ